MRASCRTAKHQWCMRRHAFLPSCGVPACLRVLATRPCMHAGLHPHAWQDWHRVSLGHTDVRGARQCWLQQQGQAQRQQAVGGQQQRQQQGQAHGQQQGEVQQQGQAQEGSSSAYQPASAIAQRTCNHALPRTRHAAAARPAPTLHACSLVGARRRCSRRPRRAWGSRQWWASAATLSTAPTLSTAWSALSRTRRWAGVGVELGGALACLLCGAPRGMCLSPRSGAQERAVCCLGRRAM